MPTRSEPRRREDALATLRTADLSDDAPAEGYPFDLAAVRAFPIEFSSGVTVFVGENGSGKSTLVEAIAVAAGFNPDDRFLRHLD